MALSINQTPAVSGESSTNRAFAQSLERLSSSIKQYGVGAQPAAYGEMIESRVKALELGQQVRDTNDSVTEARIAGEKLTGLEAKLREARGLVFGSLNEPGRRLSDGDRVEFSKTIQEIDAIAASVVFGGGPLLEGSQSFGSEGELQKIELSDQKASVGAIQVIDRAISEVTNQRGLLGIFQTAKLTSIGNLLRQGLDGVVSSNSVIRSRVVAQNLATSAAADIREQTESSLLGSNQAAGQILASIVGRL